MSTLAFREHRNILNAMNTLLERFLSYVRVDTTSDATSKTVPSTAKQFNLLKQLQQELTDLGAADVTLTETGYVLATVPASAGLEAAPTVCFLAHVDTSPAYSGTDVTPIVHENYQGQVLILPKDTTQILDPNDPMQAELKTAIGKDLITSSGDTLLGADNKAGVAIIMTMVETLLNDGSIPHGKLRVCFTPDEEIGRGVDHVSLEEIGADVAYTADGGPLGDLNWETFSADGATIIVEGVSTHPGTAQKYGMVNAIQVASRLISALPVEWLSPETTDVYQGFVHPYIMQGNSAKMEIKFILRDHDNDKLAAQGTLLEKLCDAFQAAHPTAKISVRITPQYRNMGYWLRDQKKIVDLMKQATINAGVEPCIKPVRGGTDGSRLTEKGLPTPNIFTGGHNYHGPQEWITRQDMEKSLDTLIALATLWGQETSIN